jgi:NSS family neurotransmitter:Na+ symporter
MFGPKPPPNNELGQPRERWALGRKTFVLAAMGSAIGVGNIWKFPSVMYEFGGAGFFVPYLIALLFVGIPILILEITLGQKF